MLKISSKWIFGLIIITFILSGCGASGKDSMGCFPPSCSLIPQEHARKKCEDWENGLFVWSGDCKNAGSSACSKLCEKDTALFAQGKKPTPAKENATTENILKFLPSEVDIYGRDWYKNEVDLPLTGTIYVWGPTLQTEPWTLKWLQDRGAKKIYSQISIWNEDVWKTIDKLPEELKTASVKGFNGEPLFVQNTVFLNILDPAYQNWIKAKVKEKIDLGTNGFSFDEHWGTEWAMGKGEGPCDEFALAGFRQYLEQKYSETELNKKGITDIKSFNYCQYIVDHHLLSQYQKNYRLVNLGLDYQDYLLRASNSVINEIIQFASSYAQEKGKQIGFGANYEPMDRLDAFDFINQLDTFVFEHEWFPRWREQGNNARFPAGVPVSPAMKYAFGKEVNAAAMLVVGNFMYGIGSPDIQSDTTSILHQLAEAYANRGFYMYFEITNYLGKTFHPERERIYPYYMFLRNEPRAFLGLQQNNNLAVVLSPHATINNRYSNEARAISLALSEANIQHDVIDLDKINEYPTVLATGFAWSEAEVDKLLQYIDTGGTVVSVDNRFASLNEKYEKVSRPKLQSLKKSGTHTYGKGKFIFFTDNLGEKIWLYQRSTDKAKIISAVADLAIQNIAPENIQVLPYVSGERLVVHLLNYDFQNGDFTFKENFEVRVHVPENFSTEGKTLKIILPDFTGEKNVQYQVAGGMISFTVPSMYIWDVAILE